MDQLSGPAYFFWQMTASGWREARADDRPYLDFVDGSVKSGGTVLELEIRELPFRFIQALTRGLSENRRNPCSQMELFAALYPGEIFDSYSSPLRIHAVLGRIRFWAAANSLPLVIQAAEKQFSISPKTQMVFRAKNPSIFPAQIPHVPIELRWAELALRTAFKDQARFKSSDVQRVLNVSLRTSVTHLKALSEIGKLGSSGQGRARRYWLAS